MPLDVAYGPPLGQVADTFHTATCPPLGVLQLFERHHHAAKFVPGSLVRVHTDEISKDVLVFCLGGVDAGAENGLPRRQDLGFEGFSGLGGGRGG
jgi:hypothetical protein